MFAPTANGQENPSASTTAAAQEEEDDIVVLNAFTVSSERDYGYRAANTISGTRSNTPIKDIPLNIQVFTKELADDLAITNQVELEDYNASLVNGGADRRSNNPIQQSFNQFLFRGFVQNWGLRDGIREYDPVDFQGLARVEVVKGPAAALYGLAYPGGVMNNVTKDVDYSDNFTSTRLTFEDEGGYRGAIDANYSGEAQGGKFGVRLNAAHASSEDERAHSKGQINYTQLNLNWRPTRTTELKFLAERGYREKPNGLGYFVRIPAGANNAEIPLQIDHPEIPWEWNWSNGKNMRSLDTRLYRGTINQALGENFQLTGYLQYSKRNQTDGDGWDANGSGGADSWEAGGGWIIPATGPERIEAGYSYRTWDNAMHSYGATGVYKFDFGEVNNTFTFGANVWTEEFVSRSSVQRPPTGVSPVRLVYPVRAGIDINIPFAPPGDLVVNDGSADPAGSNGYTHESNSNDYYFANWQASLFENRLKTNLGINRTNLKLLQWSNGVDQIPNVTDQSENSPLIGGMYDITDELSVYAVYSKSLFPTTDKNSFGGQMPPVVGTGAEGGLKFGLFEGKLSGTVSYYQIEQEGGAQRQNNIDNRNTQRWDSMTPAERLVNFPTGTTRDSLRQEGDIVPGAKAESTGFEIDLNYQPTRNWAFQFSFADNDQEVTEAIDVTTIGRSNVGHIDTQWSILTRYTFTEGGVKGLYLGTGLVSAGKALQGYVGGVPRYNPSTFYAELFGGYRFKLFEYDSMVQLNIKNITGEDEFVGWIPNGSALSTERYRISMPMRFSVTFGIDL